MRMLVFPGDGIGPEIVAVAVDVATAAARRFDLPLAFDEDAVGFTRLEKHGTTLRDEVLERARTCDGVGYAIAPLWPVRVR